MSESREEYINFIVQELLTHPKGIRGKSDIIGKFRKKFEKEKSTFNDAWAIAKKRYIENTEKQTTKLTDKAQKEISERSILTKIQALEILSEIAQGKDISSNDNTKENTNESKPQDRIKAIDQIAKIEGWNAPQKTDLTTNGKELNTTIIVHDNKMAKKLKEIEKQNLNEMK